MMTAAKLTREQFKVRQLRDKRALEAQKKQVLICAGTGCIAGGSLEIYDYIQAECQRRGMEVHISLIHEGEPEAPDEAHDLHLKKSGCHGFPISSLFSCYFDFMTSSLLFSFLA